MAFRSTDDDDVHQNGERASGSMTQLLIPQNNCGIAFQFPTRRDTCMYIYIYVYMYIHSFGMMREGDAAEN